MTGPALSLAAAGLIRALAARSGASRDQVLIGDVRSTAWHSLTFDGERHHFALHIIGANADAHAARMAHRLEEAEFAIPGILVADIIISDGPKILFDGSATLAIEALTVDDV